MRLLLTSQSLYNDAIKASLASLLDKPSKKCRAVYISTSQNGAVGDKTWYIRNLNDAHSMGWQSFEIIDVAAVIDLPRTMWRERIEKADVIFVGGGANFYLGYWLERSGLADALPRLLESKVYVGASAGSMVMTSSLVTGSEALKRFAADGSVDMSTLGPEGQRSPRALGFVDALIKPHYNKTSAKYAFVTDDLLQEVADTNETTLYALDDDCALKVVDASMEVVGGGQWKRFEPMTGRR